MHLIIDGYGGDPEVLNDVASIYALLDGYPPFLGMTKISPPFVFYYNAPKVEDSGVTGVVFIAESHISIHTFPYHSYVNIDVFSCKDFDAERALADLKERLGLKEVRSCLLHRGLVGKDLGRGQGLVLWERSQVLTRPSP